MDAAVVVICSLCVWSNPVAARYVENYYYTYTQYISYKADILCVPCTQTRQTKASFEF